jgi:hypothetical protein
MMILVIIEALLGFSMDWGASVIEIEIKIDDQCRMRASVRRG